MTVVRLFGRDLYLSLVGDNFFTCHTVAFNMNKMNKKKSSFLFRFVTNFLIKTKLTNH